MSCPSKGLARGGRAPKESSQAKAQRAAIFSAYECVSNHVERAQWNLPPAEYPPLSLGRRPHELLAVFEITPLHESDVLFPGSPLTGGPINRIQIIVERHRDTLACVEGTLESFDINACKVGFVMPATLRPIFINRTGARPVERKRPLLYTTTSLYLIATHDSHLAALLPVYRRIVGVARKRLARRRADARGVQPAVAESARGRWRDVEPLLGEGHGGVRAHARASAAANGDRPGVCAASARAAVRAQVRHLRGRYAGCAPALSRSIHSALRFEFSLLSLPARAVKKIEGAVTRQLVRLEKYLERFPPPSPQPLPSITATAAPSSSGQEAGPSTSTSAIDGYLKRPREDDGLTMQEFFDPSQEAMA